MAPEASMKITLEKMNEAVHFVASDEDGKTVLMDGSPSVGGQGLGMRPMHLVLSALAGCSAIDVVTIIKKQRMTLEAFSVEVEGLRAEDQTPAVFTDITLHFICTGKLDETKVSQAIQLSVDKYCSVAAMLRPGVRINHRFTIKESSHVQP